MLFFRKIILKNKFQNHTIIKLLAIHLNLGSTLMSTSFPYQQFFFHLRTMQKSFYYNVFAQICLTYLNICEANITVAPVNSCVLHHQSVFIHGAHLGENRHQLVLKTVSWDSGDIHFTPPRWWWTLPPIRRSPVNSLSVPL